MARPDGFLHEKPDGTFNWKPLAPTEIEDDIRRLCERLEEVTDELATASHQAAVKDATYKQAHAASYLMAAGKTVGDREAVTALETADEYLARKIADALLLATQESARSIRAQLDALRTLSASLRVQV